MNSASVTLDRFQLFSFAQMSTLMASGESLREWQPIWMPREAGASVSEAKFLT